MQSARSKILILGASSYVGRYLFERLGNRAIGTYCSSPIHRGVRFDSLSMNLAGVVSEPESISHAVILLGDTDPDSCVADIKRSQVLNVDSIASCLQCLAQWDIKPVFTSSEFVFDGLKGNYIESDRVNPVLVYGRQKVAIERYLENYGRPFVIARLAKVVGIKAGDGTLFTSWLRAIAGQQQSIQCAQDQVFSPVYVGDVVEGLIRLIEMDATGIFHFSCRGGYSRLTLLQTLLEHVKRFNVPTPEVVPCSIHDFSLPEKRPLNVSMNPDRLSDTIGLVMRDPEWVCQKVAEQVRIANKVEA